MKKVKIGEQVWTKRNLKVSHYRNGDIIPEVQNPDEWAYLETGAWCYYNNKKKKKYGKLYNWYAVNDPRGLAPKGWHIPTKEEFDILMSTVKYDGNSLKAERVGTENGVGTNTSGFSALLSGVCNYDGTFYHLDDNSYCWSSTAFDDALAYSLGMGYYNSNVYFNINNKDNGYSVRLIKD